MKKKCMECGKTYTPTYNTDMLNELSMYCDECIEKQLAIYKKEKEDILFEYNHIDSIEVKERPKFGYCYMHSWDEYKKRFK